MTDEQANNAATDPCEPSAPRVGFPVHPYGNGQFAGTLRELYQIVRRYYHCDVKDEVALQLFGHQDTEGCVKQWAMANRLQVDHIDVLASWRFWW